MRRLAWLLTILLASAGLSATGPQGAAAQRVRLVPQFTPGRVLRYQLDFRTTTENQRVGLVEDPQAPTAMELAWSAVVRVEVLSVEPDAAGHPGQRARLRTTYEKSEATVHTDSFDPAAAAIEAEYRKLAGRTVQFTLDAQGKVTEVEGLQDILKDEKNAAAAREWLAQLAGTAAPEQGIVPGQKWTAEQPVGSAPLAGLVWRTEATYLRDESCRPVNPAGAVPDALSREPCAVILTRLEMAQPHAPRDPTPEDYRARGLRTAGQWRGSGESLSYISLHTGWVVSLTQSGVEQMDFTVSTADSQSSVRYAGRVRSQSQITLLPEPAANPR